MSDRRYALVIDMQNDFMPGGACPVPGSREIVPNVLRTVKSCNTHLFSYDLHNKNNISFAASHEGKSPGDSVKLCGWTFLLWEPHCLTGTRGALIVDELMPYFQGPQALNQYRGFPKGHDWQDPGMTAISPLCSMLSNRRWRETFVVMGVGLDHAVRHTVLSIFDYFPGKFDIEVKLDSVVSFDPAEGDRALQEMQSRGAILVP